MALSGYNTFYKSLILFPDADIQTADQPRCCENAKYTCKDSQGLPEAGGEGILVCDDQRLVSCLIDYIHRSQCQSSSAKRVHKCLVR